MGLFDKKKINFLKEKIFPESSSKKEKAQQKKTSLEKDIPGERPALGKESFAELTDGIEKTSVIESKSEVFIPTSLLLLKGSDDLVGVSWILDQPLISIGRSFRANDITVPHPNLSKKHFQILKEGEEFYVVDLQSTNGTRLNEEKLTPHQKRKLKDNDYIRASSTVFKFLEEGNIEGVSSRKILSKASTDALTGIGNRRRLTMKGADYFHFDCFSMIVFDVDKFKNINDTLGHSAGDYVLKMIVQNILEVIRDKDLFIRYGGDEFCILSPEPLDQAYKIAERIRYKIENMNLVFDNKPIQTRISVGVAEKIKEDSSWEDIYHRADKLSYEEKNYKKNKTAL